MEVAVERAQAPPCPNEPSSILVSLHVWERLGLSEDSSTVALRDPATGASVFATARCNVDGGFSDATMSHCVAWATLLEDADIPAWLSTLSVSAVTPVELDSILLVLSADASISTDDVQAALPSMIGSLVAFDQPLRTSAIPSTLASPSSIRIGLVEPTLRGCIAPRTRVTIYRSPLAQPAPNTVDDAQTSFSSGHFLFGVGAATDSHTIPATVMDSFSARAVEEGPCGVCGVDTLARMQAFDGSLVSISLTADSPARLVRLFVDESGPSDAQLALDPVTAHNLQLNSSTPTVVVRAVADPQSSIPVARRVTVARVTSPHSSGTANYTSALRSYFSVPRYLAQGDLLLLPSVPSSPEDETDLTPASVLTAAQRASPVLFSVAAVEGDGDASHPFAVIAGETTLLQSGAVSHAPPSHARSAFEPLFVAPRDITPASRPSLERISSILQSLQPSVLLALDASVALLISGPRGAGKRAVFRAACDAAGVHLLERRAGALVQSTEAKTRAAVLETVTEAAAMAPVVLLLNDIHELVDRSGEAEGKQPALGGILAQALAQAASSGALVVLAATTTQADDLPVDVRGLFAHHVTLESPDASSRQFLLSTLLRSVSLSDDTRDFPLAERTAGLVPADLVALVSHAVMLANRRAARLANLPGQTIASVLSAGPLVCVDDLTAALERSQRAVADALGAPKIPNVTWDDVGGLVAVKRDILDTIQLPLQRPDIFASNLRQRSGVLLYGPPGTGKTLLAKAVATECALNFLSVKGPELINMYVGESEKNVRELFQKARNARPCVIFFDELDSLAPNRGRTGDSGGVMDRIVSQLLAELDGITSGRDVFVIGATNRPDLIDPALLRPGRFDKLIYLSVSEDHPSQFKIMSALTRKFRMEKDVDLNAFVERLPFTYTGADFYALCSDAMLNALKRRIAAVDAAFAEVKMDKPALTMERFLSTGSPDQLNVAINMDDLEQAREALRPSVTEAELARYRAIQTEFAQQGERVKQRTLE